MLNWLRIRPWRRPRQEGTVLETYRFLSRTVRLLQTEDRHLRWTCDCEMFRRQGAHRERLWCKHIAWAAARRSLERLSRRVALAWGS